MSGVAERLKSIQDRIVAACLRAGRSPEEVTLLAVSKTFPVAAIREAHAAGQRAFGESRQQEAEAKIRELPAGIDWHFIGKLQRNKVRKVLAGFTTVHSVDSARLARQIDRIASEENLKPEIYLEINIGEEPSKAGFVPEELGSAFPEILALKHVKVLGLMAIPPACEDPEEARAWFIRVREYQATLAAGAGVVLPGLSIGMSADFEVAIEEGSTIVRVGSAIFGERDYPA